MRSELGRTAVLGCLFGLLSFLFGQPSAHADFVHPGVVFSIEDLNRMKVKRTIKPWKTGYADFCAQPQASLNYTMRGPFEVVGREPNVNRKEYESDILAVEYQAIQWYITRNPAYAENAIRILNAWTTTHKTWSGSTPRLAAGWNAINLCVGAEILRYTYPNWTQSTTDNVQRYLINVMWPMLGGVGNALPNLADANQGAMELRGAIGIAVFCNDRERFAASIDGFLNHPTAGIVNGTLPSGQFSDFGRDQTHAGEMLQDLALTAQTAWIQNVDLYGTLNNRLLTCMEYFTKYNLGEAVPFVPFGPGYSLYLAPSWDASKRGTQPDPTRKVSHWVASLELYTAAYPLRKSVSAPYTARYLSQLTPNRETFQFKKDEKPPRGYLPAPAIPPLPARLPAYAVPSLTGRDIGSVGLPGSVGYAHEAWTVSGSGSDIGGTSDSCHFAYRTLTGDGSITARVVAMGTTNSEVNSGIMMRKTLDADSPFALAFMRSADMGAAFITRTDTGGAAKIGQQHPNAGPLPYWLKIKRRGDLFIGYHSFDGLAWTPLRFKTIPMGQTIYVGLAVCSHQSAVSDTATFDHVTLNASKQP